QELGSVESSSLFYGKSCVHDQSGNLFHRVFVILAVPYASALEIAASPSLSGKIVVDISNPLKPDFSGLIFGHETSAADKIQNAAIGAKVVKAF
ncbi:hypothetical protein AB9F34_33225, partial [Rhizobium leguminosarum]